jgi:hypothetical protein
VSPSIAQHLVRPPSYKAEPLSQEQLQARHEDLETRHRSALTRVEELVRDQAEVSAHLTDGISEMQAKGGALDGMEEEASRTGLVAALSRMLSRRGAVLARRSISDALVTTHERAVVDLRRAGAVTDALKRTAAELHREIEGLHRERALAKDNLKIAAERVLEIEAALDAAQTITGLDREEWERRADTLRFQERSVSSDVALLQAHVDLCRDELAPAQALRDTVQSMHEEMSRYVVNATKGVNGAGRKIQALGMAADAATVVAELQESMHQLDVAMTETTRYLVQADDLLTRVLPELNARLIANEGVRQISFEADLDNISRERARALADKALLQAAKDEVESISDY